MKAPNAAAGDWSPPATEAETGVALSTEGGLPLNSRLRAEALAKAGAEKDEEGLVSPELIAETRDRLQAEEAYEVERREAEAAERPAVSASMKKADLEKIAEGEKVDLSTATNNDDRVALIEAARATADTQEG